MVQAQAEKLGINYYKLFAASTISNLGDGIGVIAYPWLASALTRNPLLIALVAVVQRLPWLLFSLPAGAITDRYDRRKLMVGANTVRAVLTLGVALALVVGGGNLPGPDEVSDANAVLTTNWWLYSVVLGATMLLGTAEVLYDNTAQTIMPSIVTAPMLEKANGRLWSVEQVANTFGGPLVGALLLAVTFSLPFIVDAATFAISAALISLIPKATNRPERKPSGDSMLSEVVAGFKWLWSHDLLRTLALVLGALNAVSVMAVATLVLFAQEVLNTSPAEFALLNTGGALGGVIGGWVASSVAKKLGSGPSLFFVLITGGVTSIVIGLTDQWPVAWLMFAFLMFGAVLWNVITVSFRQTIIPDDLLGRVNSVYRFFGWGSMPIGALAGGLVIAISDGPLARETALRLPWLLAGVAQIVLLAIAAPHLTTEKFAKARSAAA